MSLPEFNTEHAWPDYPRFSKTWRASGDTFVVGEQALQLAKLISNQRPGWEVVFPESRKMIFKCDGIVLGSCELFEGDIPSYVPRKTYRLTSKRTNESLARKHHRDTDYEKTAVKIILKDFRPFNGLEIIERHYVGCVGSIADLRRRREGELRNYGHEAVSLLHKNMSTLKLLTALAAAVPIPELKDYVKKATTKQEELQEIGELLDVARQRVVVFPDATGYSVKGIDTILGSGYSAATNMYSAPRRYTEKTLPDWIKYGLGVLKLSKEGEAVPGVGMRVGTKEGSVFCVVRFES